MPIWVSEPIGLAAAAADVLDAGDERRRHRAESHAQHAELPLSRRDLPGALCQPLLTSFRERIQRGVRLAWLASAACLPQPGRLVHAVRMR